MQKVLRSTTTAILSAAALIALAACGDKVEVVQPGTVTPHITSVSVSGPTSYQLSTLPNDSLSYAATVGADAGFTGSRSVTWTSSNASVFRITSSSGAGKALAAGSTVITATSAVDGVTGQIALTVSAAPIVAPTPPASVVISGIQQGANACGLATGGNVDLGNACGQIDVSVDVSYTTANRPATIELRLGAPGGAIGSGTLCDSRSFGGSANTEADLDVSTIILSCRTAAFDTTTGVTTFKNGTYTLEAKATGSANASSQPAVTAITVNNADFVRASITGTTLDGGRLLAVTNSATGVQWRAGTVNTKILPVIYTAGRTIASATVNLLNGGSDAASNGINLSANVACGTATSTATGVTPGAVAFSGTTTGATGVQHRMIDTLIVTAFLTDATGNNVTLVRNPDLSVQSTTVCGPPYTASNSVTSGNFIRLDNQRPLSIANVGASRFDFAPQGGTVTGTAAWVGAGYVFTGTATSAALGVTVGGEPGGMGINTDRITFQYAPVGTASTSSAWTTVTAATAIAPTSDALTYSLRMITRDSLGNADTSIVRDIPTNLTNMTFGVDLRAPFSSRTSASVSGNVVSTVACTNRPGINCARAALAAATFDLTVVDSAQGTATGSGFDGTPLAIAVRRWSAGAGTTTTVTCVTGTSSSGTLCDNTADVASTGYAFPVLEGAYRVKFRVADQANNRTPDSTFMYYIDNTVPVVAASPVAIPASIGAATTFSTTGGAVTDNQDIAGANGYLNYPGPAVKFLLPGTSTVTGVALDSTLVRSGDATVTLPTPFYRFLTTMAAGPAFGAGSKPDGVGIRAYDAAQNLSAAQVVPLPAANISGAGAGANPYTIGAAPTDNLQDFTVAFTPAAPDNTPGPAVVTITGRVTASTATVASPFTQVCFYYTIPATTGAEAAGTNNVTFSGQGDLVLIGCSATPTVTTTGTNRLFDYGQTWTMSSNWGAVGTFGIRAVGVNANGDALITLPATLTTV